MLTNPFSKHPLPPPLPIYEPHCAASAGKRPSASSAITVTTSITSSSAPSTLLPTKPSNPLPTAGSANGRRPGWRAFVFGVYTVPILNTLLQLAVIVSTASYLPSFTPSSPASSSEPDAGPVSDTVGVVDTPNGIVVVIGTIPVSLFSVWWVALTGIWAMHVWCWPVREAFAGAGRKRKEGVEGEAVRRERVWGLVWGSFLPWVEAAGVAGVGLVVWGC